MPNDRQIEEAQEKEVLNNLKKVQQLEKMSNDEKAPETASAARQLIERLKQPRKEQVDYSALFALASPSVGQRLLQASSKQSPFSQEEQRLAKAAELENTIAKLRASSSTSGNSQRNMAALEKAGSMASGTGRGATNMRKAWDNIARIDKLKSMAEDFDAGRLTFDPQSNMEYSAAISGLITDRAPGIETIRETAYSTFGGDVNKMVQYITGQPREALSQQMMKEISRQIYNIEKSEKQKIGKTVSRLFNAYRGRFKNNPEQAALWSQQYGNYAHFDLNNMSSKPRDFDDVRETRIGREQPASAEVKASGNAKVDEILKLMGE